TDIISRREETYHRGIKVLSREEESTGQVSIHDREKGISREMAKYLAYDQYTHTTLLEHFLSPSTSLSDFQSGSLTWLGTPPHKRVYHSMVSEERDSIVVSLVTEERVGNSLLEIKKEIRAYSHKPELGYEYTLVNKGQAKISFLFVVEFCFATSGEPLVFKGRSVKVAFQHPSLKIEIETTPETEWWSFPVKTLSQSSRGFELIDQGLVYLPHLKVSLEADEVLKFQIKERITNLAGPK
ncbi:DUF1926 domain-containing protein, partial [bacterium]|nr:DUF1926 domain-containing protein [bacterium]